VVGSSGIAQTRKLPAPGTRLKGLLLLMTTWDNPELAMNAANTPALLRYAVAYQHNLNLPFDAIHSVHLAWAHRSESAFSGFSIIQTGFFSNLFSALVGANLMYSYLRSVALQLLHFGGIQAALIGLAFLDFSRR